MSSRFRHLLLPACTALALSGALAACSGDVPGNAGDSPSPDDPSDSSLGQAIQKDSCQPATYDAASMYHSVGSPMQGGWSLWGNGYASTNNTFAAGPTTITVSAGGSSAAGVWPHMVVSIDGTAIGDTF